MLRGTLPRVIPPGRARRGPMTPGPQTWRWMTRHPETLATLPAWLMPARETRRPEDSPWVAS